MLNSAGANPAATLTIFPDNGHGGWVKTYGAPGQPGITIEYDLETAADAIPCVYLGKADIGVTHEPSFYDYLSYQRLKGNAPTGITILTGTSPHGQGHATVWAMLASDELGIPVDEITVKWGDTDLIPEGGGTGGSRSLQQGGAAVQQASRELIEVARQRAASELEANPADLVFDAGRSAFAVAGDPEASVPLAKLAAAERLVVRTVFTAPGPTFPFGAHLAVVEVDTETGKVALRRIVTVDDAGTVINPLLAEGQRHGGIAQGAAQAFLEEFIYDADGNPLTASFADYPFLSATEVPSFELADMATPTSYNPLGAKGIGEAGTIGATPAVQNAIIDALAHLGVRHIDMPASPQRVWQALQPPGSAAAGPNESGDG